MPQAFDSCVANGGQVRTKKLSGGKYMHLCFPKDGGPSVAGEVKQAKTTGKVAKAAFMRAANR